MLASGKKLVTTKTLGKTPQSQLRNSISPAYIFTNIVISSEPIYLSFVLKSLSKNLVLQSPSHCQRQLEARKSD